MAQSVSVPFPQATSIPVRDVIPWAAFTTVMAVLLVYFAGVEQGALSLIGDNMIVHEFVHDARHLAGFPCH